MSPYTFSCNIHQIINVNGPNNTKRKQDTKLKIIKYINLYERKSVTTQYNTELITQKPN